MVRIGPFDCSVVNAERHSGDGQCACASPSLIVLNVPTARGKPRLRELKIESTRIELKSASLNMMSRHRADARHLSCCLWSASHFCSSCSL
jgi:hypothetical protein